MILHPWDSEVYVEVHKDSEEFHTDLLATSKAIIASTPKPVADHNVDLWVGDSMLKVREYFKTAFDLLIKGYDEKPDYDIDSLNIINPMEYGDFKSCHTHDMIDAFAIYYVNEPKDSEGGKLRLYDPRFLGRKAFAGKTSPYLEIKPRKGMVVAAPYYVWHEVTPYLGSDTRISLVCNMVFKDDTGSSK